MTEHLRILIPGTPTAKLDRLVYHSPIKVRGQLRCSLRQLAVYNLRRAGRCLRHLMPIGDEAHKELSKNFARLRDVLARRHGKVYRDARKATGKESTTSACVHPDYPAKVNERLRNLAHKASWANELSCMHWHAGSRSAYPHGCKRVFVYTIFQD